MQCRKATRSTVGGELSEQQVEEQFATIRNRRQRITREATLHTIQQYFEAAEEGVQVALMTISLKCPISGARVKDPVRTAACKHVDCFDLRTYLVYHKELNRWTCPVPRCAAEARCDSLHVDEYMSEVLRKTDGRVKEVAVRKEGYFEAVLSPMPTAAETMIISDENPYIPVSIAEPTVKTEENNDSLFKLMETENVPTDQNQSQTYSLAVRGEEQLREEQYKSSQQNATLRCELVSEKDRADKAESEAARLRQELAEKVREIHELKAENAELQSRLDAMHTAADRQMSREPTGDLSKDQGPREFPSSLTVARNDGAEAAVGRGEKQLHVELADGSISDDSVLSRGILNASANESDSDGEEQSGCASKLEVVRHAKETKNISRTARHFANLGHEVDRRSVRLWIKDEEKLKEAGLTKSRVTSARRKPMHPQFDDDLAKWIADSRAIGRRITSNAVIAHAKDLARARQIDNLKFSGHWWREFRKRYGIDLRDTVLMGAAEATTSTKYCSSAAVSVESSTD